MAHQSISQVLIIGGGPTGLFIGSLLIDQGVRVIILEKRKENTRKRPVKLLGRVLLSDIIVDEIYVFSENQIEERQKAIDSMKLELFTKITGWLELLTPIRTIEKDLTEYFVSSGGILCSGEDGNFRNLDSLQDYPDTLVIDCTGYHSVLRNHIKPNNRIDRLVEYVIVWTFVFNDPYECNERCKFYKNRNTKKYKVIPFVHDTYIDGDRKTHITCLITIDKQIFEQLSTVRPLTLDYFNKHFSEISEDMDTFLNNLSDGDINKFPIGLMDFHALPLNVYCAKRATHIVNDDNFKQFWLLMGDAAMGGPYFQSISIGYEAAIYFAYIFKQMNVNVEQIMTKYENYMEKLWITMQIRSKTIQGNKNLLQAICSDNRDAILENMKIY